MKAIHLKTEYLENPMGIDSIKPRFFWICEGGKKQTAYEIICTRDDQEIWNTGKCASAECTHIPYEGETLKSRDRVTWKVRLWDENDEAGEYSEASFEMGLLDAGDWQAKWISGDYKPKKNVHWPVGCFQKTFRVRSEIARARLYITACGLYEAHLNGQRVGDMVLAPGNTDVRKRLQYQTYDVTELLESENTLDADLADGWFRGYCDPFGDDNVYGKMTALLAQLEISYADGSRDVITTDESWKFSGDGPLQFADLRDGEICDASRKPSYCCRVRLAKAPKGRLAASNNVVPKKQEEFTPQLITTPSGKKVLDFGQNIAGFIAFDIQGEKGQKITLTMGEILDENGEFTQKNFQCKVPAHEVGMIGKIMVISGTPEKATKDLRMSPLQQVVFTCSGGEDHYETRFGYFGFRYALVETDLEINPENFRAIAVYSDMKQTGHFSCSNQDINAFVHNAIWSTKGNFCDVPTDCPTRERLGWTGDAQIYFNTGSYLMDSAAFYRKYLKDLWDAMKKDGKVPAVVPYNGGAMVYDNTGMSVGWADVVECLPYRYYKKYGDLDLLKESYPYIRRYAGYLLKHTGHKDRRAAKADPCNKYIYEKGMHLGEWAEPAEFQEHFGAGGGSEKASHAEEATGYFSYAMGILAEIAEVTGHDSDADIFREYEAGSAKAYDENFLNPIPTTDRQAKLVRPLAAHVVPEKKRQEVVDHLVQAIENRDYCVMTGFLSTPFILPVLTENGRTDVAYRMMENTKAPGWLFEVKAGATTVWETWEGDVSRNHYSPGASVEWLFETVAGIQMDGRRKFRIAPIPGGTLTEAQASYESIYGTVSSSWKKEDEKITYTIVVPSNTTAEITLPGQEARKVGAGKYTFTV